MQGNSEVIATLQAALSAEGKLNLQSRLDTQQLKFMGVPKLACKFDGIGDDAHCYLKLVTKRCLFLNGNPSYTVPELVRITNVTDMIKNTLELELGIVGPYEQAVQVAQKAMDDTTRNLFEHLLKWHQKHVGWLEKQLRLINILGESDYISEKL